MRLLQLGEVLCFVVIHPYMCLSMMLFPRCLIFHQAFARTVVKCRSVGMN